MLSEFEALPETGRIRLSIPPVYKDGSSVPLAVEVDSPMTEANYVSHIHVVAPDNPLPEVASFHFTPLGGKASASTRIRLEAGNQTVVATAELSDGSVLTTRTSVRVAIGGCTS
jgi:sulfur-oxidizing protein SoxY